MAEQWAYHVVIFVQAGEGRGGLAGHRVIISRRIDSFEILEQVRHGIEQDLFPDGPPDLPENVQPVVLLDWKLVTARQGPDVPPLQEEPSAGPPGQRRRQLGHPA